MIGTSETTGKLISGLEHLQQSITRLLLTPIGSRCWRRDYGSYLFELLDHPGNEANRLKLYASIVDSILRWERRLLPVRVTISMDESEAGKFYLSLDAVIVEDIDDILAGTDVSLAIPLGGYA